MIGILVIFALLVGAIVLFGYTEQRHQQLRIEKDARISHLTNEVSRLTYLLDKTQPEKPTRKDVRIRDLEHEVATLKRVIEEHINQNSEL